jgi:hypothetical protein
MHPITALMLSRVIEDDHRRDLERRSPRRTESEPIRPERAEFTGWSLRHRRFDPAGSKA